MQVTLDHSPLPDLTWDMMRPTEHAGYRAPEQLPACQCIPTEQPADIMDLLLSAAKIIGSAGLTAYVTFKVNEALKPTRKRSRQ